MAGLPGTGKSSIAKRLAAELPGIVLDKDWILPLIFLPSETTYARERDDFCTGILYQITQYRFEEKLNRYVILDGRTYTRKPDVNSLVTFATSINIPLKIIMCCCSDDIARQRLLNDIERRSHSAQYRNPEFYDRLKAAVELTQAPKLVIDTGFNSLDECVRLSMNYITYPTPGVG